MVSECVPAKQSKSKKNLHRIYDTDFKYATFKLQTQPLG